MHGRWIIALSIAVLLPIYGFSQTAASSADDKPIAAVNAAEHASLQAAIDALGQRGGVVQIPAGRYELTSPLVISHDDVALVGAGTATQVINKNEDGASTIIVRHPDQPKNAKASLWRVSFSDLRIVGQEKCGHGIEATHVNEIFIHGVTINYHGGDGIKLDHCYEDPRICDSLITYNKQTGLNLLGCHDIVVSGNHFEENQDAVHCFDGFNLCMTGNNVDDHLGHGVVVEDTYGSVISGNMIEECQGVGVVLDRDCYGIAVSANVIAHDFGGGVDLRDANGIAVTGNSFPLCGEKSGFAVRVGPTSGRSSITGNTFSNTYVGEGKARRPKHQDPAAGLLLAGGQDLTITANTFTDLSTKALAVEGTPARVIFTANILVGVESDEALLRNSVVRDNIRSGAAK